jgi:hypothetical protein
VDAGTGHIVVAPAAADTAAASGAGGGGGGGTQGSYSEVPDGVAGDGSDVMRTPEMVEAAGAVHGPGRAAGAWGAASAGRYVPVASDGAPVGGGGGTEAAT